MKEQTGVGAQNVTMLQPCVGGAERQNPDAHMHIHEHPHTNSRPRQEEDGVKVHST